MSTVFPLLAYLYRTNLLAVLFPTIASDPEEQDEISSIESENTQDEDDEPLLASSPVTSTSQKQVPKKLVYHIINISILISCILTAIFFPKIGKLISLSGSLCGAIYIFFLPYAVHWSVVGTGKR